MPADPLERPVGSLVNCGPRLSLTYSFFFVNAKDGTTHTGVVRVRGTSVASVPTRLTRPVPSAIPSERMKKAPRKISGRGPRRVVEAGKAEIIHLDEGSSAREEGEEANYEARVEAKAHTEGALPCQPGATIDSIHPRENGSTVQLERESPRDFPALQRI
ncbi:uncharacterized protein A4U43_C05F9540 [Asparagus officinalis]|uniref:Uncharacterized protein n=1 Tax=Asparagus officinalis TaxID=4686 RepID=A0A5P1ER34_ASPOF|nr:uncharacterized protein A4U43_C05F9540 [Asparagus officinalis]